MVSSKIEICEVGPRDGLQSEPRIWTVEERVELIDRLSATGVPRIEAVSFVNPKRVPQMADAEVVMAKIKRPKGVKFAGLALNAMGAERAIEAGVDEVRYVVVASETFNQRNQGATINESLNGFSQIASKVINAGLKLSATVAAAFGCPFEGKIEVDQVAKIANKLVDGGCVEIGMADTIGSGVPTQVTELFSIVRDTVGSETGLGFHLHNTRNTGFANAAAAANAGVLFLDASVGGLGGCPFAPKATGNIATEDLCFMLRNMGFETGINIDSYIETSRWAETFFESPLPGQIMKAGLFPETVMG
ncbi:MAG: hydroxymethylglutaryl-CoA lyase [Rhodospirillaceae bacterium]|nr:hydroxymethylglutaryl-CoA lyase [Rhodospirillaceae bacterium]OUT79151.1 MAG: hydroxymethylglutaryl-CoA lyase [Rhodospirillaceae bacterium TMED23]|tara:strand:- start:155 stop:1069 length:915 start_codon:yes stop_codon:yes gene_type:complete